jgi:hypothetical protein
MKILTKEHADFHERILPNLLREVKTAKSIAKDKLRKLNRPDKIRSDAEKLHSRVLLSFEQSLEAIESEIDELTKFNV